MALLRDYLQRMSEAVRHDATCAAKCQAAGRPYFSCEEFVLKHGQSFEPAALTAEEKAYVGRAVVCSVLRSGSGCSANECYANSERVLFDGDVDARLVYVEGYIAVAGAPYRHGWLELAGKVVDLTPPLLALGVWSDEREYFGVRFATSYVRQRVAAAGVGSLIDDGTKPILKGEPWEPAP